LSENPTKLCVSMFIQAYVHSCLQEHLAPLGSISKQAHGMVSNASSLATSLLKGVLDDFRYIMPASMSSTSRFSHNTHHSQTHTCSWSLHHHQSDDSAPAGAAAAASAQQLKTLCCVESFVYVLQRKGNGCVGAAKSG